MTCGNSLAHSYISQRGYCILHRSGKSPTYLLTFKRERGFFSDKTVLKMSFFQFTSSKSTPGSTSEEVELHFAQNTKLLSPKPNKASTYL